MTLRYGLAPGAVALAVVVATCIAFLAVITATASPFLQAGEMLPTPTLNPVSEVPYTLETVGGSVEPFRFTYEDQDGITFGETVVTSRFPQGMTFALTPTSSAGDIAAVKLNITFQTDHIQRPKVEWSAADNAWIASLWGPGDVPAWVPLTFSWHVTDSAGTEADTPPLQVSYYDPSRIWHRMESDDVVVYWYGIAEDDPDAMARAIAQGVAAATERYETAFGVTAPYKVTAVLYPTTTTLEESTLTGIGDIAATMNLDTGVMALRQIPLAADYIANCIWYMAPTLSEDEIAIADNIFSVTFLVGTLYQGERQMGTEAPWWYLGELSWLGHVPNSFVEQIDQRLHALAVRGELPPLEQLGFSGATPSDGCLPLPLPMGWSFVNFLNFAYGGLEGHRQIVDHRAEGMPITDAIAAVAGKPFLDVQNEWRAYLGAEPILAAELDPELALEPYEDSALAVGDSVTLPAAPMMVPLNEKPGLKSLAQGNCFGNTAVTILAMGTLDDVPYFKIDCMGMLGWVTRDTLVGP